MPDVSKILTAIDFYSKEAYDTYMKQHPNADPKNHRVLPPQQNDVKRVDDAIAEKTYESYSDHILGGFGMSDWATPSSVIDEKNLRDDQKVDLISKGFAYAGESLDNMSESEFEKVSNFYSSHQKEFEKADDQIMNSSMFDERYSNMLISNQMKNSNMAIDFSKMSPELRERVKDMDPEEVKKFLAWLANNKG